MLSLRRFLSAALIAALCACASTAGDDDQPGGDQKPAALDDAAEIGELAQPVTYETFSCRDDWNANCGPINRYDNRWMKLAGQHAVTVFPYGESGEGVHVFDVKNSAGTRYITRSDSPDSVVWTFSFPSGSTCNTYGNCSYHICSDYTPTGYPSCIDTYSRTGSSSLFSGTYWPAGRVIHFRVYYQIVAGPPLQTTVNYGEWGAYLIVYHTPL